MSDGWAGLPTTADWPFKPTASGRVRNIVNNIEESLSQAATRNSSGQGHRTSKWSPGRELERGRALHVKAALLNVKADGAGGTGWAGAKLNEVLLPGHRAGARGQVAPNGCVVKQRLQEMHSPGSAHHFADQARLRNQGLNIRQKISQWEVKSSVSNTDKAKSGEGGLQVEYGCAFISKAKTQSPGPRKRALVKARSLGLDFREGQKATDPNIKHGAERNRAAANSRAQKVGGLGSSSVLPQVNKLETLAPGSSGDSKLLPPGNFYTSQNFWKKLEDVPQDERKELGATEPGGPSERLESSRPGGSAVILRDPRDSVFTDSEGTKEAPVININPLPKPQRTFKYSGEQDSGSTPTPAPPSGKGKGPTTHSPPPLLLSPPPALRQLGNGTQIVRSNRKSFEFEDAEGLHILQTPAASERSREGTEKPKQVLSHTVSDENIYEDIVDPSKENPYEDVKFTPSLLARGKRVWGSPAARPRRPPKLPPKPASLLAQTADSKSWKVSEIRKYVKEGPGRPNPPSLLVSSEDPGTGDVRKRKKIPRLVAKIQAMYDAKRGKKKVKTLSASGHEATVAKDENSETESDTEEQQKAHSQRLVQVHSSLKRNTRYQTLERDLIELQEQKLFEYFVVVSLRKKPPSNTYKPQVTQQFPSKLEKTSRQARDAEERLKAIPQFCFPDADDWVPVSEYVSETFSFVLTGEDGSRRFGYCRKLLPNGRDKRLPEVYCIVSRLGCFYLFSKILDEVEKRRKISPPLVYPFMRSVMEAPFPAPGRVITIKNFLPGSGNEVMELCRPSDSRLEHVDFECLLSCLNVRHLVQVFASLLLERRVIFIADKLSTLSKCGHAVVAMLYPFTWQHTYIPVLPAAMIDIVCSPTPFLIGILSNSMTLLNDLPIEEVLVVDLCADRFLRQMDDEDSILPRKLQAALELILEQRSEILAQAEEGEAEDGPCSLSTLISEAFVRFFVEIVGHHSLHMSINEKGERVFQRDAFRKSHTSKSVRQFLELFMEAQMFAGFIQDRELRKSGIKGLFEVRAGEYLETIPESGPSGVNKFLKGLGNKMKFLSKKGNKDSGT
ncbi:DENN domain-containing protein 2C isoform X1 [Callorhinchus milii]|uniref:DENN domain-containing protein 2C isoform X1 n=2 Tax=Callorhinchus milii TaxID=7868 RepID=UPI001C3F861B|nr:DENN domain-containing protein 2C isoform X1 [Callorhinchus milii]